MRPPSDSDAPCYRFSIFELDARTGELRKQGLLIRLQGQPLQILLALLERPGTIVSRDELRQRLWPGDTFVEFDHSLNTAIKRLRETIGDTATLPRFIETVPRRGYRFLAPVERPGDVVAAAASAGGAASGGRAVDAAEAADAGGTVDGGDGASVSPVLSMSMMPSMSSMSSMSGDAAASAAAAVDAAADEDVAAATPALALAVPPAVAPERSVSVAAAVAAAAVAEATSADAAGAATGARVGSAPPAVAAMTKRRRLVVGLLSLGGVAAIVAAIVAGLLFLPGLFRPRAAAMPADAAPPRLAVLSFENLTGDPSRAHVAEGFTEELVAQLGRLAPGRLGVIARSSSASFDTARTPLGDIARALAVDYVIEGSVRGGGDRYRLAVRLVRARDLTMVWSELYEGALLDMVSMQRDVGQQVARRLAVQLLPEDQAALARATTSDSRAYEAYLRGVSELARGPGEGFTRAADLFTQAVALDPRYALAHAALAQSYILRQDYYLMPPATAQAAARAAAEAALAVDEGLAEAHCALADILSRTAGESAAAERAFRRALALNPSRAETQWRYAAHLMRSGRDQEGRDRLADARILAPRSADVITEAAWMEMNAGRLDAATRLAAEALRYQPDFPFAQYVQGQVALRRAAPDEAIAQFARARITSGRAPKYVAALGTAYLAAARPADAARVLEELRALSRDRYVPPEMIEDLAARLKPSSTPAAARGTG